MRRTRFAAAIETTGEKRPRASIREALWFDIATPEEPDDHSLSAWRIAPLEHSALILGVTHLFAALALMDSSSAIVVWSFDSDDSAGPAAGARSGASWPALRIDCIGTVHGVRWLAAYLSAQHALDEVVLAMLLRLGRPIRVAILVMGGGLTMAGSWPHSPPLALVNLLVTTAGAFLLTGSPLIGMGTALLSLIIVAYSVGGAQTVIAAGRERLNLDGDARKALTFVAEFESSGRGWFWETNSEGTLSYVSSS